MKHALGINAPATQGQLRFNFKSDEEYLKSRSIELSIRGLHEDDVGCDRGREDEETVSDSNHEAHRVILP